MELGTVHHGGLQGHVLFGIDEGIHHDLVHRLLAGQIALDHQRAAVHVHLQRVQRGADGAGSCLGHQNDHIAAVGADVGVVLLAHCGVAIHQGAFFVAQLDGDALFVRGVGAVQVFAGADIAEQVLHFGILFQFQGQALFAQQGDAAVGPRQDLILVQLIVENGLAKGGAGLVGVLRFGDGEIDGAVPAHSAHQPVFVVPAGVVVGLAAALRGELGDDPAALAVGGIVVVARQIFGDLGGEALQIHRFAGFDGDLRVVGLGHVLIEDRHALFGGEHHQLAVLVDVGELVAVEGVCGGLAVHGVEPLALFVEGIRPQSAQLAQKSGHDLVGGVGDAVELGAEGHLAGAVQHQAQHLALFREVEGIGDAVAFAAHLVVFRQRDLLDGNIRQRAGDEHGGLFAVAHGAAGPQDEQAARNVLGGAVAAQFHLVQIDLAAACILQQVAVFIPQDGVSGGQYLFRLFAAEAGAQSVVAQAGNAHLIAAAVPDDIPAGDRREHPVCVDRADLVLCAGRLPRFREIDVAVAAVQLVGRAVRFFQQRVNGGLHDRLERGDLGVDVGAQIPLARFAVFAGLVDEGILAAVAACFVRVHSLTGSVVCRGEGDGDILLACALAGGAHGEFQLAGGLLITLALGHSLGPCGSLTDQRVNVVPVAAQIQPRAGMAVHQVIRDAAFHESRVRIQVGPDLLAVHRDALASRVLHVILKGAGRFLLSGQFAAVRAGGAVVFLPQPAVLVLIDRYGAVLGDVLDAAGIILGGKAGGDRLQLCIAQGQGVAVQRVGDARVHVAGGAVAVLAHPGVFREQESRVARHLAFGRVGHAVVRRDFAQRCAGDAAGPECTVQLVVKVCHLAVGKALAGGNSVAQAGDVHQLDGGALVGEHAVPVVPDHRVAGAREIIHLEGFRDAALHYLERIGSQSPAMVVAHVGVRLNDVVLKPAETCRLAGEVLGVDDVVIALFAALLADAAAGKRVEAQAVAGLVVDQQVIIGVGGARFDVVHGGLQAAEVIVVGVAVGAAAGEHQPDVHLFQAFVVGEGLVALLVGVGDGQTDTHRLTGFKQALAGEPGGADGFQQDLVGGVLVHGEMAGGKVDGDAFSEFDLGDLAASVLHKLEVAHRRFGAALFDAGDVAEGVHIEQGAVGQQVAVEPLGRVVALEVIVQHGLSGEKLILRQLHGEVGDVAQGPGHGDGDGGAAGDHGGLHAFLEVQLYVAVQRDHPLDVHRVVVALQHGVVFVHDDQDHRHDVHEHVAAGLDVHHAMAAGEHIGVESLARRAHAGRAPDQQVMGPYRRHAGAGRDVGHAVHAGEGAALFAGPDELHMAVGVGDKSVHLHAAGSAEFGAHFGLVIRHIVDGMADAEHGGLHEAAVGNVDAVQLHVVARTVGDDDPGQHRLVVDDDAARGVFALAGEVRHTGQVVADVPQDHGVARQGIELAGPGLLDAHLTHGQLALMLGDVDVDAARRVAQVEDGAAGHAHAAVASEGMVGDGLFDDEAAFAGVLPDAAAVEAVAGDRHGGAPQGNAVAQHGAGRFRGGAAGLGQGLARRVQLDGGPHVDVGVPVGGLGGSVDVQAVVAGDVGPGDVHIRVQGRLGVAEGVHRRAQGRSLGVGVGVDVQFAVAGDDLHVPPFDDRGLAGGPRDDHVGIQAGIHVGGGIGGHAQAGGIRADVGLHARLGGVGEDVHGAETGLDEGVPAHFHPGAGGEVHLRGGGAQSHQAAALHFGAGGDAVGVAAGSLYGQVAVVGFQDAAVLQDHLHRAVQSVPRLEHLIVDEGAAVGVGGGVHPGRGGSLHGEGLIGVQGAVHGDGVVGVDGVLATGDVGVDGNGDAAASGDALGLGGVLAEDAHAAAGGADDRAVQHVHTGVVPADGGQHAHAGIAGGHAQALADVGRGVAGVVGPQGHVPLRQDGAAVHPDADDLAVVFGSTHSGLGGIHTAGHQGHVGLAGRFGRGDGVAHRLGRDCAMGGNVQVFQQRRHLIAGG